MRLVRSGSCVAGEIDSSAAKYLTDKAPSASLMLFRRDKGDNNLYCSLSVASEELAPVCTEGLSDPATSYDVVPIDIVIKH